MTLCRECRHDKDLSAPTAERGVICDICDRVYTGPDDPKDSGPWFWRRLNAIEEMGHAILLATRRQG